MYYRTKGSSFLIKVKVPKFTIDLYKMSLGYLAKMEAVVHLQGKKKGNCQCASGNVFYCSIIKKVCTFRTVLKHNNCKVHEVKYSEFQL